MSDNDQYLQMFFDEAKEYIQILNESILDLENNPDNTETINALFRAAHSLKGMSATMGFDTLTELTHKLENLMDKVREGKLEVTTELIDLLFAGIDHIEHIVNQIKETGEEDINLEAYLQELKEYLEGNNKGEQQQEHEKEVEDSKIVGPDLNEKEIAAIKKNKKETDAVHKINIVINRDTSFPQARASMLLKAAADLGYIVKSEPERENIEEAEIKDSKVIIILISSLSIADIEMELRDINDVEQVEIEEINLKTLSSLQDEKVKKQNASNSVNNGSRDSKDSSSDVGNSNNFEVSSTVRVDIKKLDNLMNMIGELLINKTRLQSLDITNDDFKEVLPQLDRVTMELHHTVMQIRMEPVGVMFNRFPRMVRDLSKEENKEINFVMEGEDTELDRSIIDELGDPMTHLLRNAIDHGIEKPQERIKKGKDEQGTLYLRAYQKGSEIIIEVEDDGAGINREKIVEKAVDKGLVTTEAVEEMDDQDILQLIFHPGLSTSEEVSDVSGRGVGMDVVKSTIEGLDGEIFIESEKDEGTKFTISLPLTLAITEALMVKIDKEIFAIPLSNIQETLMIRQDDIRMVKGKEVINRRQQTIPLLDSRKSLDLDTDYGLYKEKEEFPAVIIQTSGNQFGLIVDELLQQQEIVIKSLGDYLQNVENISGATIIGDGEVALILDVRNIA